MDNRQVVLPANHSVARLRTIGKWITIFLIAIPMGIGARECWDHGIVMVILLSAKAIALGLWGMVADFAGACIEFLFYVFHR